MVGDEEMLGMVVDIEPHVRSRVEQLVAQVGESEFRRGVAQMTRWDTEIRSLDDVICLYVLARRGRVAPPEMGRRAVELYPSLPGRTDDDMGFRDSEGRPMTPEEYVQWRTDLRTGAAST
jgi:hypothetical protein